MAQKINGITIALNADTRGVTNGLKDLTDQSMTLSKQLKSVDALLQMDPGNAELMAKKQELLAQSVDVSRQRLEALRGAQEDVKASVENGSIGTDEYIAFQRELITTEKRMQELEKQSDGTGDEMQDLGNQTEETGDQMQEIEKESGKLGEKLKSGLAAGAKMAAEALAATTAAAAATVAGVVKTASATAETGDHIDKMSQKLGISAEKYQEWDAIMQHSGSDVDKMGAALKKLGENAEKPSEDVQKAFSKIGISAEKAAKMSRAELFSETIIKLQGVKDETERAALANDLLGKSASELGALLNTSAEDTEAMRKKVHELGGVMSNDAVKAAARYQDSLQDMKTAVGGIVNSIGTSFMPSISDMMDGFAALVTGNEEGIAQMEQGLDEFVKNLENTVSNIAAAADKFLPTIINAIAKNLPKIAESALKILKTLADALLDNLPQIVSTAAQIILSLAKGLAESLPTLVPQVVGIIKEIVNILTDKNNLDALIDAAIAILTELSKALVDNLPELVEAALTLVTRLVEYLFDPKNIDKLATAAFEIIVNLAKALVDSLWKIGEAVGEIVKKIVDALGLGEYWEAGMDVIDKFMGGVVEKWNQWKKWWEGFGEAVYDYLHGTGGDEPLIDESKVWKDPRYSAKGGVFTVPTRAIIGENGAEVVLPLENNTGWMDILAAKLAAIGGSGMNIGTITVNVTGTENAGMETVQAIDEALREYQLLMVRGTGGVSW